MFMIKAIRVVHFFISIFGGVATSRSGCELKVIDNNNNIKKKCLQTKKITN